MKIFARWLSGAIVTVVIILFSATRPALADSYTVYDLGDDSSRGIYGIDAAGDVVTWGTSGCGSSSYCYETYVNGVATNDGGVPPVLAYDDGTSCGSGPVGFNAAKTVCNGGWIGMGTVYNLNSDPNGIYLATGSGIDFLGSGSADQVFLNSAGDFAWTDGLSDEMYVAMQNPAPRFEATEFSPKGDFVSSFQTPEPGSLLLMATGLMGVTALIRKANR